MLKNKALFQKRPVKGCHRPWMLESCKQNCV